MSLKVIDRQIKQITTNANKLNVLIHATAMLILRHAAPVSDGGEGHGDCSRAQTLLMAMPASMRRTMLRDWFHKYSPILVKDTDPNWNAKMHKAGTKLFVPFDLAGADAEPFFKMAEATPEEKSYDFEALMKMVERLSKTIEKKIEDGLVPDADIESAKAVARAVAGLKVDRIVPANTQEGEQGVAGLKVDRIVPANTQEGEQGVA